jgi:uncharacterized protein YjiS (DUF1127 family)
MSEISRSGGIVPAPRHGPFRRRVPFSLSKSFDVLLLWLQRRRERRKLVGLSDHVLKDIGLTRADAEGEALKAFWRR